MGVLAAPWSDLALLLRHITDPSTGSMFPLWISGFVLFVSVCLILIQLIMYFSWKLTQTEAELSMDPKTSALSRPSSRTADRSRRSRLY